MREPARKMTISEDEFDQQARAALLEMYGSQLRHWTTILFSSAIIFLTLYGIYTHPQARAYTETVRLMLSLVITSWPFISLKLLWWGGLYPKVIRHNLGKRTYRYPYIYQLESEITDTVRGVRASWLGKRLWFLTRFHVSGVPVYPLMVMGLSFALWLNWEVGMRFTARLLEVIRGQATVADLTLTPTIQLWLGIAVIVGIALTTWTYPWYKFRQR